jgi:N-methylhydantoinase A
MQRYLAKLEASLAAMGVTGALYVMLSGGGIASVQEAKDYPIRLIESGPAAGAMAASWLAQRAGLDQVISYDMGGTTAKMCLIQNGAPDRKFDFEAGRVRRFQKGSGLPLKVSVVDMIEIGAGGGSIARVDPASGLMKVGPRSAGAKPGPICYGRGGVEPTVTDSDLVLGRLDPAYFLGGEIALDLPAVTRAVSGDLSAKLGVSADDAALGIRRIVDETMAAATRMHMAEKGRDPRRFTLIAFGGAGPVHACDLARLLKIKRVLVPLGAGVASAIGFLVAPPATDLVRSLVGRLERLDWAKVAALYAEMVAEARGLLLGAGADPADIIYKPAADMRYVGQGFEIPVPMPSLTPGQQDIAAIEESFLAAYRERFGRALDGLPIEALTWRLAASAPGRDIAMEGAQKSESGEARRGTRRALFEGHGWCDCAVYDRYRLAPGTIFAGPALVEERESTCVIPPGAQVSVDRHRNLVIELA